MLFPYGVSIWGIHMGVPYVEIEIELKIELKLELKIQIKRTELPKASLSCFVIFYYRLKPF